MQGAAICSSEFGKNNTVAKLVAPILYAVAAVPPLVLDARACCILRTKDTAVHERFFRNVSVSHFRRITDFGNKANRFRLYASLQPEFAVRDEESCGWQR
jgi:hypothetical protein